MTIPISGGEVRSTTDTLLNAINTIKSDCLQVQAGTSGAAAISLQVVLQLAQDAVGYMNTQNAITSNQTLTDAVVAYAQSQYPGTTFGATDFANTFTAASNLFNAIAAAYPTDGSGHLLDRTFNTISGVVWTTATAAQMPTIMSAITAFLATLS